MFKNLSTEGKYIHNVEHNSTHSEVDDEEPYKFFCAEIYFEIAMPQKKRLKN